MEVAEASTATKYVVDMDKERSIVNRVIKRAITSYHSKLNQKDLERIQKNTPLEIIEHPIKENEDYKILKQPTEYYFNRNRGIVEVSDQYLERLKTDLKVKEFSPASNHGLLQRLELNESTEPHIDAYPSQTSEEAEERRIVDDTEVAFVMMNNNPDAYFQYGSSNAHQQQVPVKKGTMVKFAGNVPHNTVIHSGVVQLLGPFDILGLNGVGVAAEVLPEDTQDNLLGRKLAPGLIYMPDPFQTNQCGCPELTEIGIWEDIDTFAREANTNIFSFQADECECEKIVLSEECMGVGETAHDDQEVCRGAVVHVRKMKPTTTDYATVVDNGTSVLDPGTQPVTTPGDREGIRHLTERDVTEPMYLLTQSQLDNLIANVIKDTEESGTIRFVDGTGTGGIDFGDLGDIREVELGDPRDAEIRNPTLGDPRDNDLGDLDLSNPKLGDPRDIEFESTMILKPVDGGDRKRRNLRAAN